MSEIKAKSSVVKIRVEGSASSVTKVVQAIKAKVRIVDESEIVQTSKWNTVRRYLFALVGHDEQAE